MPSEEREKEMKWKRRTLDLFLRHLLVSKVKAIRENDPGPQEGMLSEESDKEEETGAVRLI